MAENSFLSKMEEKNNDQLLHVINNKDLFVQEAIEAAEEVLVERHIIERVNPTKQHEAPPLQSKLEPKEKIAYREKLIFRSLTNGFSNDIDKDEFWEKFNAVFKRQPLAVCDNKYELQILRPMGLNKLKYIDKERNLTFTSKIPDFSDDFTKKMVIAFCESNTKWKSKLDWKEIHPNSSITDLKNRALGLLGILMVIGYFYANYSNGHDTPNYWDKVVNFVSNDLGLNIFFVVAIIMGILLLSDWTSIKNFDKVNSLSQARIISTAIAFVLCATLFLIQIFK